MKGMDGEESRPYRYSRGIDHDLSDISLPLTLALF